MAIENLTPDRLRELLHYDPETGVFTWRVDRGRNKLSGLPAGSLTAKGYLNISIDGKEYYAHALAWMYVHGYLPAMRQIDRINGDRLDNRIANFRLHIKTKDIPLTIDRVREVLSYDPETGVFRWLVAVTNGVKVDQQWGAVDAAGYRRGKFGPAQVAAHRMAWFYTYGEWPTGEIDHINGLRDDNRIANLRDVDRATNMQNQRVAQKGNLSGYLGVRKNGNGWTAHLQFEGKMRSFGTFKTPEEAHAAYLAAKRLHHPGFVESVTHGFPPIAPAAQTP